MNLPRNAGSPATPSPTPLPPARPRVRQRVRLADYPPPDGHPSSSPSDAVPLEALQDTGKDAAAPDYEVGYGKPPKHTQFPRGRSGNPHGRPRGAKGLKTMVRETMTQKVPVRTAAGVKKMTRMEALLHKTHELAMKGNARALVQLYNLYSSAVPDADVTSNGGDADDLTTTDLAILEALRQSFAIPAEQALIADEEEVPEPSSSELEGDLERDLKANPEVAADVEDRRQDPDEEAPSEDDCGRDWDRSL